MQIHKLITPRRVALAALVAVPASLAVLASARPPAPESKLEQSMQALQAGAKKLTGALEKKDMSTVLTVVIDMEKAVQDAKLETPPKANDIKDTKKKDEFVHGFRKELIQLQKGLLDVEAAAVEGKEAEASKAFEKEVKPLKQDGHSKYKGD